MTGDCTIITFLMLQDFTLRMSRLVLNVLIIRFKLAAIRIVDHANSGSTLFARITEDILKWITRFFVPSFVSVPQRVEVNLGDTVKLPCIVDR